MRDGERLSKTLTLGVLRTVAELAGEGARQLYTDAKLDVLTLLPADKAEGQAGGRRAACRRGARVPRPGAGGGGAEQQEKAEKADAAEEIEYHPMRCCAPTAEADGAIMAWMQERVDAAVPDAKVARLMMRACSRPARTRCRPARPRSTTPSRSAPSCCASTCRRARAEP